MVSNSTHAAVNILLSILCLILAGLGETVLWAYSIVVLFLSLGVQGYRVFYLERIA